jgi:hypothetical protein
MLKQQMELPLDSFTLAQEKLDSRLTPSRTTTTTTSTTTTHSAATLETTPRHARLNCTSLVAAMKV